MYNLCMSRLARIETPLKRALDEDGRRQSWLAKRLGVAPRQVWAWVHGLHVPEQATREQIARVLGRKVDDLWPDAASETRAAA